MVSRLTGVSCLIIQYCVAVGNYNSPAGSNMSFSETSIEQPTGNFQSTVKNTVNSSPASNTLTGISCAWAGTTFLGLRCRAVGAERVTSTLTFELTEVWNGSNWSYEGPAETALNTSDLLQGVSCQSQDQCMAVGYSPTRGTSSISALAEQYTGGTGPHALSLTPRSDLLELLHKPRKLELLVFKLGRHGRLLGAVALGHHPMGSSMIPWNLHVAGHRLGPGTYTAELVASLAHGATSDGPSVTFSLSYPTCPIRVHPSTCSVAAASAGRC